MIVINLTINLVLPEDRSRPVPIYQAIIDTLTDHNQANTHEASCQLCHKWSRWYETPEKARQALAGHQSWCKRNVTKKRHSKREY